MTEFAVPLCRDDDGLCLQRCKILFPYECDQIFSQAFAYCIRNQARNLSFSIYLILSFIISMIFF